MSGAAQEYHSIDDGAEEQNPERGDQAGNEDDNANPLIGRRN
jgi:hypothetical protein